MPCCFLSTPNLCVSSSSGFNDPSLSNVSPDLPQAPPSTPPSTHPCYVSSLSAMGSSSSTPRSSMRTISNSLDGTSIDGTVDIALSNHQATPLSRRLAVLHPIPQPSCWNSPPSSRTCSLLPSPSHLYITLVSISDWEHKLVVNLSNAIIDPDAFNFLKRGLGFAFSPRFIPYVDFLMEAESSIQDLLNDIAEEVRQDCVIALWQGKPPKCNIPNTEFRAFKSLMCNNDLVISMADTGNAMVIMNKNFWIMLDMSSFAWVVCRQASCVDRKKKMFYSLLRNRCPNSLPPTVFDSSPLHRSSIGPRVASVLAPCNPSSTQGCSYLGPESSPILSPSLLCGYRSFVQPLALHDVGQQSGSELLECLGPILDTQQLNGSQRSSIQWLLPNDLCLTPRGMPFCALSTPNLCVSSSSGIYDPSLSNVSPGLPQARPPPPSTPLAMCLLCLSWVLPPPPPVLPCVPYPTLWMGLLLMALLT
ncbi:hypothetical protein SUGI_0459270 [Cryptomeria japonica]|nr:hypothetical protein SUGI_0459270 [Cryptomeria japonica]